jgi:hypothetical protein
MHASTLSPDALSETAFRSWRGLRSVFPLQPVAMGQTPHRTVWRRN